MADHNLNPARKPHVYDLLGQLNASFARLARNLNALEQSGMFEIRTMRRLYFASRELQADANYHLLETLQDCEERDWARYGRRTRPPAE